MVVIKHKKMRAICAKIHAQPDMSGFATCIKGGLLQGSNHSLLRRRINCRPLSARFNKRFPDEAACLCAWPIHPLKPVARTISRHLGGGCVVNMVFHGEICLERLKVEPVPKPHSTFLQQALMQLCAVIFGMNVWRLNERPAKSRNT